MTLSIFHLNIQSGRFLDEIIAFVKQNDFDILQFQEVSGGKFNSFNHEDNFEEIKQRLDYTGELTKRFTAINDPSNYFANATFIKADFSLIKKQVLWLAPFQEYAQFPPIRSDPQKTPYNLLHLTLEIRGKRLHSLNTHLAWGPTPEDEPYKVMQGKMLYEYVKQINEPFVLSGDFNLTNDSQVVKWMQTIGRDLATESRITNTLNSKTHHAPHLFPPGLAVDYIFVDKQTKVLDFQLIDKPDLSDHLGLMVKIEI